MAASPSPVVHIVSASTDGYVARDLLASPSMSKAITSAQRMELEALVRKCGLDAGTIPCQFRSQLTDVTDRAACTLTLRCRDWQDGGLATARDAPHAADG